MRAHALLLLVVTSAAGAACGLETSGELGAGVDSPPNDDSSGSIDATTPAEDSGIVPADAPAPPMECEAGTTCASSVQAGWSVVAFATNRTSPCPSGFGGADVVLAGTTPANACRCACTSSATDPPSCAKGSITGAAGTGTTCNITNIIPKTITSNACTAMGGATSAAVALFNAVPFNPGTCVSSAVIDKGVPEVLARVCAPTPACIDLVCAGEPPAGFASCIAHDGDVPCPGAPWVTKHVAGASVVTSCGGCATCANSATCSVPTLRYYNDANCTNQVTSFVVNGVCNAGSGAGGQSENHYKYDVTMSNVACAPTSTATASASVATPRTICCRP